MQQVTHRKMSINYKFKNHHYNSQMLQEKMRDSEWKRSRLEIEYKELVQQSRTEQETDLMGYKRRYRDFLESEKYRIRRNEQLFAALKRLEMRISFLSATTEKYKALRSKHQISSNKTRLNTKPIQASTHYDRYFKNEPENNSNYVGNLNHTNNNPNGIEASASHANLMRTTPSDSSLYESNFIQHRSAPTPTSQELSRIIDHNIEQKYFRHPTLPEQTSQIYKKPLAVFPEMPIDENVSLPTSYIAEKQDGIRRDEIEYSDNFRHRIPNNSNAMSLGYPKYDSVDRPTSDINKYAIGNSVTPDLMIASQINEGISVPKVHDLAMPEEILRKYQRPNRSIAFDSDFPVEDNFGKISTEPNEQKENIVSHKVLPSEIPSASHFISTKNVSESENLPQKNNDMSREMEKNVTSTKADQTIHQVKPVAIKTTEETTVENRSEPQPKIETPALNPNELKSVEAFPLIEEVTPSKETEITEPQRLPEQEKAVNLPNEVKIADTKRNYVPQINTATERTIDEFEIAPINTATERTIVEFEIAANIEFETFDHSSISSEPKSEKNTEENEAPLVEKRPDAGENVEIEPVIENYEVVGEKLSQLNLEDDPEHVEQFELEKLSENKAPTEAVENSDLSNDQEVAAEVCQVETSDENISNSHQNFQQEITDPTLNPEERHDNSDDSEMKKFKKHTNGQDQYQYYDQNNQSNQNYPPGQQYDRSGHPINYDPAMTSAGQYDDKGQAYPQNYDGVYNDKGELVMPYDQTGHHYDQQYYQNDPNYANYDQYGQQQYDDQQQYSGYDQQGYDQQANYDPAQQQQQANYDPAQQGSYDPAQQDYSGNARYNAYYAEVKYDQGAFYQGDTQENPQHEENEEVDKTSRLANMLESDTENSISRQEHKVTTESDFDYSNN